MPDNVTSRGIADIDGAAIVEVKEDMLAAYLLLTPPQGGGKPVTLDTVNKALAQNGVKFGLNMSVAEQMISDGVYSQRKIIAEGIPAVNGIDGSITYLFETTDVLKPRRMENGGVDYKDLGLVKNILKDTAIATLTAAVSGNDGMNVKGVPIKHKPGLPPKFQLGKGVTVSEDEKELIAAIDGNLAWQKDRFVVEETLVLQADVGVATGNIDFMGDVVIKGGVLENFLVKSGGSVTIAGGVHGAEVVAERNIDIKLGSVNSKVTANGDIKINFCESSKVHAGGDVSASSFVASEVFAGGTLSAATGKGVVVGGKYIALQSFVANILGSESFTATRVTIGNGGMLAEERLAEEKKIATTEEQIKKLMQISDILQEHKKKFGPLSPDRDAMLTTAIRSRFTLQREIKISQALIKELDEKIRQEQSVSAIVKKDLWPGVNIRIGTNSVGVDKHWTRVSISERAGEVSFDPITGTI